MNKTNILGTCLIATAILVVPLAAAGSQTYTANQLGLPFHFVITGTLSSPPMLTQTAGRAVIIDAVFNPLTGTWSGDIKCLLPPAGVCTGTVSS